MKIILRGVCLVSVAAGMWAQSPGLPLDIPIKNWDAPLHWLPPAAQEHVRQKNGLSTSYSPLASQGSPEANSQPLTFVAVTPCRVMDSRTIGGFGGAFGPPSLQGGVPRLVPIPTSACGIPASAAYSLNITLQCNNGPVGFVAAWPSGQPFPGTSITNAFSGGTVANAAVVPAGPDGGINVMVSSLGDVIIDINGFYTTAAGGGGGGSNATTVNGANVPAAATFTGTNAASQFTSITAAQATSILNTFTNAAQGVVPGSGGGSTNFLRADGAWAAPPGGGGGAPNTITLLKGSAATPPLNFTGDLTTGIFSGAASTLNIATGGANRLTVRSDGDVDLSGNIRKAGTLFLHNLGSNSVGVGLNALRLNTGSFNTAVGGAALSNNTTGGDNTMVGESAGLTITTGGANTAVGSAAMQTANASGNTAIGSFSMGSGNVTGDGNTALGQISLQALTSGARNVGIGQAALQATTVGADNTAVGQEALKATVVGSENTAVGKGALTKNLGSDNTGVGKEALNNLANGNNNIAIGVQAGGLLNTGSNNIFIGSAGADNQTGTMILGGANQVNTFIFGISGKTIAGGQTVLINAGGQLGTINSSRRYKDDIQDMSQASSGLLRLRPVTFRYKQAAEDGSKPLEYGLIAEEVAEVYPDLVLRGKDGQVETVQYHKLTPMLLNEVQKQSQRAEQQDETIRLLQAQIANLQKTLEVLQANVASNSRNALPAEQQ